MAANRKWQDQQAGPHLGQLVLTGSHWVPGSQCGRKGGRVRPLVPGLPRLRGKKLLFVVYGGGRGRKIHQSLTPSLGRLTSGLVQCPEDMREAWPLVGSGSWANLEAVSVLRSTPVGWAWWSFKPREAGGATT